MISHLGAKPAPQETDCLKTAAFGSELFGGKPKPLPVPIALRVNAGVEKTGAVCGFSHGWERGGSETGLSRGRGSLQVWIIRMKKPPKGFQRSRGEILAYMASSSLSAHSVVLEPSRSTTVSRQSRVFPSGGCMSGIGRGRIRSQQKSPPRLPTDPLGRGSGSKLPLARAASPCAADGCKR